GDVSSDGGEPDLTRLQHRLGCAKESCMAGHPAHDGRMFIMYFAAKEMAAPFILFRRGKDAMPERHPPCRSCLTHIKQSLQADPLKDLSVTESRPVLPGHALKHLAQQDKPKIAV